MPAIVDRAFRNSLKPSITAMRCFTRDGLFNQVVQVFRRAQLGIRGQPAIGFQLTHAR